MIVDAVETSSFAPFAIGALSLTVSAHALGRELGIRWYDIGLQPLIELVPRPSIFSLLMLHFLALIF